MSGGILAGMRGIAILSNKAVGKDGSSLIVESSVAELASIPLIRMPLQGLSDDGFGSAVGASDALSPSDFP